MWRRRILVACLLLAPMVATSSRPAFACSCAGGPVTSAGEGPLFVGTVRAKHLAWWRLLGARTEYRVDVDRVYGGTVHETAWIVPASGGPASCGGLNAAVGERLSFGVSGGPWTFHGNSCSTRGADAVAALGRGSPPRSDDAGIVGHWAVELWPLALTVLVVGGAVTLVVRGNRRDRRVPYDVDEFTGLWS
jgi:hypothetical protein